VLHLVAKCYTCAMPTTRPRHMITESDRLTRALEDAGVLWPEANGDRGVLLRRILEAGMKTVEEEKNEREGARRTAIDIVAGSMAGVWPADWRSELRDEWPA
jgi:hypothetical protein